MFSRAFSSFSRLRFCFLSMVPTFRLRIRMSIASRGQKRGFVTKFNLAASLLTRIKIYMTLHLGFPLQHSIPSGLHHPLSLISLLHSQLFGNGAISYFDTPFTTVGDAARSVSTISADASYFLHYRLFLLCHPGLDPGSWAVSCEVLHCAVALSSSSSPSPRRMPARRPA